MATLEGGPRSVQLTRDDSSHRDYKVCYQVKVDPLTEGPASALLCPGLPQYGDPYNLLGEFDFFATCRYPATITMMEGKPGPSAWYEVELTFTTRPDTKFCLENQVQDPLLLPPKVSGESTEYTEEATFDRFGNPIVNSAWEQLRGPQVEFDKHRHRVHVEMPVPVLQLELVVQFINKVNAFPIWNCPRRTVKLSNFKWERKFYGICFVYYTWMFDFDIRADTFDRVLLDEGTKVLHGHWDPTTGNWVLDNIGGAAPDPSDPQHFDRYKDRAGENTRIILNGAGLPAGVAIGTGVLGTGAIACYDCTTTPLTLTMTGPGGTSSFSGDYVAYNTLLGAGTLSIATDFSCYWSLTTGVVTVSAVYNVDAVARKGTIELFFSSTDGSVPSVSYLLDDLPLTSGKFDCVGPYDIPLQGGDPLFASAYITLLGVGTITGTPLSGGPGYRYIQKYDEADFALLGIPLTF